MENGRVAEQGPYDVLKQPGTRFNHLVRSQLLGGSPAFTPLPLEETLDA